MTLEMSTAEERLDSEGLARERFVTIVFLIFAFLGLALETVGLYSVASYIVSAGHTNLAYASPSVHIGLTY